MVCSQLIIYYCTYFRKKKRNILVEYKKNYTNSQWKNVGIKIKIIVSNFALNRKIQKKVILV
jgi:hypothetical protein